jgi:hypothetical protein
MDFLLEPEREREREEKAGWRTCLEILQIFFYFEGSSLLVGVLFRGVINVGRAAREASSATWSLGTNSEIALRPRKTTESLDRVGRSQSLPNANCLLASGVAFKAEF